MAAQAPASQVEEFPSSFICPLTHEVMRDPVVDLEGNSYERAAIEEWLKKNSTSPITRTPLNAASLAPNRALREAIEEKFKQLGKEVPPVSKPAAIQAPIAPKPQAKDEEEGPETVKLQVVASTKIGDTDEHDVLVTVHPPAGSARTPVDICCVVDISGSMGTEATLKGAGGQMESHGLSLLDIVKHAVKTISQSLTPLDRLAIVSYSTAVRTEINLTFMDAAAKTAVDKKLESLQPEDSTNIWGGLEAGLEVLRTGAKPGRFASLLLLTDGWPNICPPRGEVAMFKRYKDTNTLPCTVSTFGFGYNLNSDLLNTLALEGNGMFSFIPDSSFVGTAFVNATSNLLASMGKNLTIALEPQNGAKIVSVPGNYQTADSSWGTLVHMPSLQYGQDLGIVVRMKIPATLPNDAEYVTATLKFDHWNFTQQIVVTASGNNRAGSLEVDVHRRRLLVVDGIKSLMVQRKAKDTKGVKATLDNLIADLKKGTQPREKGLLEDATGQIQEALSKDEYFDKWGQHYLPSLCRSHQLQQSNNFKDPGIQFYGGALFQKLRDDIDDMYNKLPPPKPSRAPSSRNSNSGRASAASYSNFSMSTYNSCSAPCFAGTSSVLMANGCSKYVKDIQQGDEVASVQNQKATVTCVVKTVMREGQAELVELDGGLQVTPYHPIRLNGKWQFPKDVKDAVARPCPAVYSFVLQENASDHIMIINNVECVTLGHNYKDGEVVSHPYFGSRKIREDLSKQSGWNKGLVQLVSGCMERDPVTGLICGIRSAQTP